jgi:hypothetical protein
MTRRETGPRRSNSINAYLLGTRILAVVASLALVGGILSDLFDGAFWRGHALIAGLASSVLIVMLSAGIFNEAVERRRRQRWSVLAQYVMFALVRNARAIWISVVEQSGLLPTTTSAASLAEVGSAIVTDPMQFAPALARLITDRERRQALHDGIAASALHSDEVLGRWAAVMLNADLYAEIIDRHVELASNLAWLSSLLDCSNPPDDEKRLRLARASAAVQVEGEITDELLVDRLVVIARLAVELDRTTLELAFQLVPVEWWRSRLGAAAPPTLHLPRGSVWAGARGTRTRRPASTKTSGARRSREAREHS